jgi:hypothetical protein
VLSFFISACTHRSLGSFDAVVNSKVGAGHSIILVDGSST